MRGFLPAALALSALLLSTPVAGAQTTPPTLTGETLSASGPTTTTTSFTCNPSVTSTFSYQTTGTASAPYLGTYTETGTVTMGPQTVGLGQPSAPSGFVTSWTASFTITSTAGNVTGTKTLLPPPPGFSADVVGICQDGTTGFPAQQSAANFFTNQRLAYTATITVAGGAQFRDTGTSGATVNSTPSSAPNAAANNFIENYKSQQTATTPLCDDDSQDDQNQDADDQGCAQP